MEIIKKKKLEKIINQIYLPVILFYYELIFHFVTGSKLTAENVFLALSFSLIAGSISLLVISSIRNENAYNITYIVLIFIFMIPFIVQYLVFRQFNIFYDVKTVVNGAGGVVKQFLPDVAAMVFTVSGIITILLYLIPTVLKILFYVLVIKKYNIDHNILKNMFYSAVAIILGYCIFTACLNADPYLLSLRNEEYNFSTAVSNFGLLESLKLDVFKSSSSSENEELDFVMSVPSYNPSPAPQNNPDVSAGSEADSEPEIVDFGKNELDIDFQAIADSYGGTIKSLAEYCMNTPASSKNEYTGIFEGKNLIFITAEAFSGFVIDEELTPTLYRLANKGIVFNDFYQPATAGTTGGEFTNLMGMLPMCGGGSLMQVAVQGSGLNIARYLDKLGYYGKMFHNNDYQFYSRDITHNRLGYSDGFMGYGNGIEAVVSSQWPQSDLEMIEGTLPMYIDKQPFNIYYMTVSGHSGYAQGINAMSRKNWDKVENIEASYAIKAYTACQLELENALTYLVSQLEEAGIADDTVIVISPDHFPYGLTDIGGSPLLSELYGYQVDTLFDRDKNRLIIWSECLEDNTPIVVDDPCTGVDILPTLLNLFGCDFDSRLYPGRDVFSDAEAVAYNSSYFWKTTRGTYINGKYTPVNEDDAADEEYVEYMKNTVLNKIKFTTAVLQSNFYRYVFPPENK